VVQRDGKWFAAFCPEVPEANGQGKTREDCLESLAAAIELVLDYKREQGLENAPRGAELTSTLAFPFIRAKFKLCGAHAPVL
jgi:predicted RNase H-like HicB family nuclease